MPRLLLSDELWPKLEKILLQQTIYHEPDLRMTVEGMLYRLVGGRQVAQRFQRLA